MPKIFIVIFAMFSLFSAEPDLSTGSPIRRAPATNFISDQETLKTGGFAEKLITMVVCYHDYPGLYNITEQKIINHIRQNPDNANPYSLKYDADLITLASRYGFLRIVQAIAESNQRSIRCRSGRCTPLDEAVAFEQKEVAKYLYKLDAPMWSVPRYDLHRLIEPSKKRKWGR